MATRFIVFAALVAACCAKPFYFSRVPEVTILRTGRSPSIAYGFGSGFASDIGGIKHSNSIGASFQTGDAQAFGSGIGSTDGNVFARGIGYAQTNPNTYRYYPTYSTQYATPTYSYPQNLGYNHFAAQPLRNSYGNAISSAQNFNSGNYATDFAQAQNGPFGSVASAGSHNPYQSRNGFSTGYGSAVSSAVSSGNGATAVSVANSRDAQGGYRAASAASEIVDGVRASTAQTVQQNGGAVQHSGATTIDGPGIQASHAHAINTGAGTYY